MMICELITVLLLLSNAHHSCDEMKSLIFEFSLEEHQLTVSVFMHYLKLQLEGE